MCEVVDSRTADYRCLMALYIITDCNGFYSSYSHDEKHCLWFGVSQVSTGPCFFVSGQTLKTVRLLDTQPSEKARSVAQSKTAAIIHSDLYMCK